MSFRISRRLFVAIKTSPEAGYRIASKAGITASCLSRFLHDVDPLRPDDPRVIAVAAVVGVPPDEAFERVSAEPSP